MLYYIHAQDYLSTIFHYTVLAYRNLCVFVDSELSFYQFISQLCKSSICCHTFLYDMFLGQMLQSY